MRRVLLLTLIPVLFAGCALHRKPLRQSTTSLEEIDPALQAKIARGQIEVGYTPEMVERAIGQPAQIRAEASGNSVIATWTYPDATNGDLHVTVQHGQVSEIRRDHPPAPSTTVAN